MDRPGAPIRRMLLALAATLAVLFASVSPLLAGHQAVDTDCAPVLIENHDHSAHRLIPAAAPEADHCAACHLARSARGTAVSRTVLAAEARGNAVTASRRPARTPAILQTDFTRGPPR